MKQLFTESGSAMPGPLSATSIVTSELLRPIVTNSALDAGRRFTGIQQKVVERTLQLAGIEPGRDLTIAVDLDPRAHRCRGCKHTACVARHTVSTTLAWVGSKTL